MSGKRSFTDAELVVAATQVFWDRGYEGTAIDDLQEATGLSRSSLYLAFGTKRAVFDAAVAEYVSSFVDPRISPLEAPGAGVREAAAFFREFASYYRRADADRGCLLINAMAELAGRDPSFSPVSVAYHDRLRGAFANALGNAAMDSKQAGRRSAMLTASTLGVWITVRFDPAAAATTCRALEREILSWGTPAAHCS